MSMFNKSNKEKPSRYFNFGVGWLSEQSGLLTFVVNWEKNKKSNNGVGYKLYLVPVDETGNPLDEDSIEVKSFRVKETNKTNKTPEKAPDYQVYAWE